LGEKIGQTLRSIRILINGLHVGVKLRPIKTSVIFLSKKLYPSMLVLGGSTIGVEGHLMLQKKIKSMSVINKQSYVELYLKTLSTVFGPQSVFWDN